MFQVTKRRFPFFADRKVLTAADIKQLTAPVDKINAQYEAYRGKIVEPIQCENCVDVFVMKERFTISVKQVKT